MTKKAILLKNLKKTDLMYLVERLTCQLNIANLVDITDPDAQDQLANALNEVRYSLPHDLRESYLGEEFDFETT